MMLKLNCDMGESYGVWKMGNDSEIFPYIHMANLACGFHASDPINIDKSVNLAKKYDVTIGAHVSYQDIIGFGRRSIACSYEEIKAKVIYQIGALYGFCKAKNVEIKYVKPHGALYNDMMKNPTIFKAIIDAISSFDTNIQLVILSTKDTTKFEEIADYFKIRLIYEVFADRNYTDEGFLVPRNDKNAVIHDTNIVLKRIHQLQNEQTIYSINDKPLLIKADTICIHGDNPEALEFIKVIHNYL